MGIITFNIDAFTNSPPNQIGNNTIVVNHAEVYTFTLANFTSETIPPFADPDGDIAGTIKITLVPAIGELKYNGITVENDDEFGATGIKGGFLKYYGDTGTTAAHEDPFSFDIADTGSGTFSGLTGIMTMDVQEYINQPPTVGDNDTSFTGGNAVAHASETVLTAAHFTTLTSPVYSDPEGDGPAFLRINIPPQNGALLWNGTVVSAGTVIPWADIVASRLSYKADRSLITARTVTFDFDIQDTGSGQWSS